MLTWPTELMALATDTPMAMEPTPMLTTDTTTTRGRLSPRLMLMLTSMDSAILVLDMDTPMAMVPTPMLTLDTTTARGRPRLSLRLMATDTDPTDTDTPVPTPTVATAVDTTGDKSSDQATNRLD